MEGNYDYFDYSQKPYSPRPSDFDSVSSYDMAENKDIKISTLMILMFLQLMLQLKSSGLGEGLQIQLKTVQDQVNTRKL